MQCVDLKIAELLSELKQLLVEEKFTVQAYARTQYQHSQVLDRKLTLELPSGTILSVRLETKLGDV